jgi:hypothetical protein
MSAINLLLFFAACLCSASWVAAPALHRSGSGAGRTACFSAPLVLRAASRLSPAVVMLAKKAKKGKGGGGGGGGASDGEDGASGDSVEADFNLDAVVQDAEKKMKKSIVNVSPVYTPSPQPVSGRTGRRKAFHPCFLKRFLG